MSFFERRPWGWMIKPISTPRFWLKLLRVRGRTSLQYHRKRDEYWFGITKIKRGTPHRALPGLFIELAVGRPKEKDNVRLDDDYARDRGDEVVVAVSGGFDPIHSGHIALFREAKKLGDRLIVFLNTDKFLVKKKGKPFMSFEERAYVLSALDEVSAIFPVIDTDQTVRETLKKYKPQIFANGGDRNSENIPELSVCEEFEIRTVFNVGGEKKQSSSKLLAQWKK